MKKFLIALISIFALTSCATIVNDPTTPVSLAFSDGSEGECTLSNKRGSWSGHIPQTFMIRRSDDGLRYDCETDGGKKGELTRMYGDRIINAVNETLASGGVVRCAIQ